jgi:hypothetical protein
MALTDVNLFRIDGSTGSIGTASIDNIKNSAAPGNNIILNSDGTTTLTPNNIIKSGTAVASTSGTFVDFTGIPSWVKRVTVMFNGVSTNGSSDIQIQLGDSGGIETTSYLGSVWLANTVNTLNTTGLRVVTSVAAANVWHGSATISLLGSNTWVMQSVLGRSDAATSAVGGGSKALSDVLTQVRITTVNGTDTFDAGSVNILFEG